MSNLFETVRIGNLTLKNRFAMAPMTRSRANAEGVQNSHAPTYYAQRSGAGLIISEAVAITKQGSGYPVIPGIWNEAQVSAWRPVADAVHAHGGTIFLQIFHTGRIAHSSLVGGQPVSSSPIAPDGNVMTAAFENVPYETPRELTVEEIQGIVQDFAVAARNAISAGFDGVEIHAANSYLIDQFIRDSANKRTDEYGTDRTKFVREVVDAVIAEIGAERVGIRFSPWNGMNSMSDSDPEGTFRAVAQALEGKGLAYVHLMNGGNPDRDAAEAYLLELGQIMGTKTIVNAGYDKAAGEAAVAKGIDLVAYGVPYLANPDLPERFAHNAELNAPDTSTFYGGGEKGYTDYPALEKVGA